VEKIYIADYGIEKIKENARPKIDEIANDANWHKTPFDSTIWVESGKYTNIEDAKNHLKDSIRKTIETKCKVSEKCDYKISILIMHVNKHEVMGEKDEKICFGPVFIR